ncbi:MAG: hypothetical protein OXE94_06125 [Aestuariivita sp.]|nr:hypothetical protein [Aestuariivita sp.]MCY4201448.1 hypothetical protein [Aestuariivita sp.]
MSKKTDARPTFHLKPSDYQPSKVELEEDIRIDTSPTALIRSVVQQVKVAEDKDA